jgi:hypothetical protein
MWLTIDAKPPVTIVRLDTRARPKVHGIQVGNFTAAVAEHLLPSCIALGWPCRSIIWVINVNTRAGDAHCDVDAQGPRDGLRRSH